MPPTVLQLVNRVLRKHRHNPVADLSSDLAESVLDALNEANQTVYQERRWDFQTQHDGVIDVQPKIESLSGTTINGGSGYSISSATSGTVLSGDYVRRVVFGSNAQYPETAWAVAAQGTVVGATSLGELDSIWPGDSVSVETGVFTFVAEYILPSTVRDVLSVRHEEQPVRLVFSDKQVEFDHIFPKPHEHFSSEPQEVIVGGNWHKTQNAATFDADTAEWGLVARIHPVPDTKTVLFYDYIYRIPEFTTSDAATTFRQVPDHFWNLSVDLAYAKTLQTAVGNDVQAGLLLENRALLAVRRLHGADEPAAFKRNEVRSMDTVRDRKGDNFPPDTVVSIDT